jgi:hypothetical protein
MPVSPLSDTQLAVQRFTSPSGERVHAVNYAYGVVQRDIFQGFRALPKLNFASPCSIYAPNFPVLM